MDLFLDAHLNTLKEYFSDVETLVSAIIEYKRVSNVQAGELTLADLLK